MNKLFTLLVFAIIYMAGKPLSAQKLTKDDSVFVSVATLERHLIDKIEDTVALAGSQIVIKKKINTNNHAVQYYTVSMKEEDMTFTMRINPLGMVTSFTHTTFDTIDGNKIVFKFTIYFFHNYIDYDAKNLSLSKSHYGFERALDKGTKIWPRKRTKVIEFIDAAHMTIEDIMSMLSASAELIKPNVSPPEGRGFFYILDKYFISVIFKLCL